MKGGNKMKKYHHKYSSYIDDSRETGWASQEEMKRYAHELQLDKNNYEVCGLPIMSDGKTAFVHDDDNHTLIYGQTGSKKTRCLIQPLINMMIRAGESFVCSDPKGELYAQTAEAAEKEGYRVIVLDYRKFRHGDGWNPLTMIYDLYHNGNREKAIEMMNDFIQSINASQRTSPRVDPFWWQKASALGIANMMFLIDTATRETANISSFITLCFEENWETLSYLSRQMKPSSIAGMSYRGVFGAAEKTRMSIMVSLSAMVEQFVNNEALQRAMSHTTFDMESIGVEKTAVYLILADEKDTYHFMATTFLKQLYESLISVAQNMPDRALPRRVNFVLDEFANLPRIDNFENAISAARSRNIRYYLVIQSLHQLSSKYGETAGEVIRSNCADWVYLYSRELPLLNELSELCGNRLGRNGLEPLVTSSQLQRLQKRRENIEALILSGRSKPFLSELADISQYDCFRTDKPAELPKNKFGEVNVLDLNRICSEINKGLRWCPFSEAAEAENSYDRPTNASKWLLEIIGELAGFTKLFDSAQCKNKSKLPCGSTDDLRECQEMDRIKKQLIKMMRRMADRLDLNIEEEDEDSDIESDLDYDLQKELERKFDELFGELIFDEDDNNDEEESA